MNKIFQQNRFLNALISLLIAVVLYRACTEFYEIAWGTGTWRGEFSRTWAVLYFSFIIFCAIFFVLASTLLFNQKILSSVSTYIVRLRLQLGNFRWLLWLAMFIAPVWFFQFTSWGVVFQKLYIRIFIWIIVVCVLTILSSRDEQLAGWKEFLSSLILTASLFSIMASLKYVNDHPFSLGWSEGNRLWDYSVLFGRDLYIYPADKRIPVLLDSGRRLVGGIPFILPNVNIVITRLWVGLTLIIPYLLLGVAIFRASVRNKIVWLMLILWVFLFLKQGPIHPPLVLGAALVALAWRSPLWYAIPLVAGAGYFVEASRFTWVFAPAMWIFMLEFASASFSDRKLVPLIWKRSIVLAVSGLLGSFLLPLLLGSAGAFMTPTSTVVTPATTPANEAPVVVTPTPVPATTDDEPTYLDFVIEQVTDQPLLWYRLLPNSTYGGGILLSLLQAVGPLLIILVFLFVNKIWVINRLQGLALALPLLAFLAVGLVASTKIGGGGDLHNMDMFFIGLLFTAVLAWENGGGTWLQNGQRIPSFMKIVIVFLLVNSSIAPLLEMRSFGFGRDIAWLKTLTDTKNEAALEMLPTVEEVDLTLQLIQSEVDQAKLQGDVLFIDQRQLLTFGYITNVPLVPEYEKKLLMNQALSADESYFDGFYEDLAAHRFSLIITEPLRTPIQDSSYQFGEENNAWVKWVAAPVLCYYEPLTTIKSVRVQLLVPNKNITDCTSVLP
jgi:hypothetical protein